jgi:hypothetical protein
MKLKTNMVRERKGLSGYLYFYYNAPDGWDCSGLGTASVAKKLFGEDQESFILKIQLIGKTLKTELVAVSDNVKLPSFVFLSLSALVEGWIVHRCDSKDSCSDFVYKLEFPTKIGKDVKILKRKKRSCFFRERSDNTERK